MHYVTVVTRHPDAVPDYLGFGSRIIEQGKTRFGDHALILECQDAHADWQAGRLGSGMHGARVCRDAVALAAWKKEWEYAPN